MTAESHRTFERTLLVFGTLCLAIYAAARLHGTLGSDIALWRFGLGAGHPSRLTTFGSGGDSTDFELWSEKRIAAYKQTLLMKFDSPLAVLCVPKLRLQVPVFDGTDDLILNRGAGRIQGTAMPGGTGNIGIAAHRDGFFRSLKEVEIGDTVELATMQGTLSYTVDDIEIVLPDNVTVLQPRSQPSLTLVTCYPFYFVGNAPQRYIVHASLFRNGRSPDSPAIQASNQKTEVARQR